jgi:maltose alpha-D-glucosyltransferase/alpha-amylase
VYAHDPQARINLGIRRRLAPLLGNHRRRIELMNALLLSLPGTPVVYYGDEIGMGDNIYLGDRNGVRTPMQWSGDRNAGFSRSNPQRLILPVNVDPEYHYEAINVEAQQQNPLSLLWWMKRIITLRRRVKAFGRGTLEFVPSRNPKVLSFFRRYEGEEILVVANLSRFAQYVELDLSRYKGMIAVELFGGTEFPPIGDLPYLLTLGPHHFYWFAIVPQRREEPGAGATPPPELRVSGEWDAVFGDEGVEALAEVLPQFLSAKRWFGGKGRRIKEVVVRDAVRLPVEADDVQLTFVAVEYTDGDPETYVVPIAFARGEHAGELERSSPQRVVARLVAVRGDAEERGVLYDAAGDRGFGVALLDAVVRRRRLGGELGSVQGGRTPALKALLEGVDLAAIEPRFLGVEQSNTSVNYGDRLMLKLFRRVDSGPNPDLEIGQFLTEQVGFKHAPPLGGFLEYRDATQKPTTLGVVHQYVASEGDAWRYSVDEVERYFERVAIRAHEGIAAPAAAASPLELVDTSPGELVTSLVAGYLESARLLGTRTAELHVALASRPDDPEFAPERFSTLYQRSLYQSMRTLAARVLRQLKDNLRRLPKPTAELAELVLGAEAKLIHEFRAIAGHRLTATRIRIHGDYHLGQVLFTGKDFVIIDFEGEPARPLSERRIKRSPLRDVASMVRSFHYGAYTVFATRVAAEHGARAPWARFWYEWVSSAFLRSYLHAAGDAGFLPRARTELETMLHVYLLEKAVYEVGYELNNRPDWTWIPLRALTQLLRISPRG